MNDPDSELYDVVASARLLVAELVEEGLDAFTPVSVPRRAPGPPPDDEDTVVLRPTPVRSAPTQPTPDALARPATPPAPPATVVEPSLGATPDPSERPTLEAVRATLGDCRRCALCERRTRIVFGDGNPDADILFVGEGPGESEDLQGLPFVGRAGDLLTQMIEKGMGIPRADVYICNIVKCRPPNNRNPLPPEVAACRPFLDGQIDAVAPRVIVSLGKPAASLLLGRDVAITRVRGTWQSYRGIPLMPTLHPAFVLRQYTPENRRAVWEDLKAALTRAREG
jgi:DNA polymerase